MAERQAQMERESGSPRTPGQQKEQAVPKAAGPPPDQDVAVESAMSAITNVLKRRFTTGGQPPISGGPGVSNTRAVVLPTTAQQADQGPAASANMDPAGVLRTAETHFAKYAQSSGMAFPPTHASDSGLAASLEDRIARTFEDICINRAAMEIGRAHV